MNKKSWLRVLNSCSDNRKSKTCTELSRRIQNLKWAGFLAIFVLLVGCVGMVAASDLAVRAAKNSTKTIPIVMVGVGTDPVETGLVGSLSRPGGNITGFVVLGVETSGKRLELFKEAVPKVARVAVLYNPASRGNLLVVKEVLPVAAHALGLTIQTWEVRAASDFDTVFATLSKERPDGLFVAGGPLMNVNGTQLAELALKNRLPTMYGFSDMVEAGGLMAYGPHYEDLYRRAATYVDKILKGRKPADLPVEQPIKFELVISLKTAKQIGLTIPPNLLARADKVIK